MSPASSQMERRQDDSRLRAAETAAAKATTDLAHHEDICAIRYDAISKALETVNAKIDAGHAAIIAAREKAATEAREERERDRTAMEKRDTAAQRERWVMFAGAIILTLIAARFVGPHELAQAAAARVGVPIAPQPR